MKKSLVLGVAMALGVTVSAYAANPFSDVPAGHWAYDNIAKLAAAGVIEGYGDDTFRGDRLMTRYEMAQIVAKAMAKGANVDKLASEFADELDALGVRVAALEKKSDNVKITGEFRARYVRSEHKLTGALAEELSYGRQQANSGAGVVKANEDESDLRSRLWFTGKVNDNWNYVGMLQNVQNLRNNKGDENTSFQRAYLEGRLGGTNVTAGRYNLVLANGNIYDTRADGIEVSYGDKVKITGVVGKATDNITVIPGYVIAKYAEVSGADLGDYSEDAINGEVTNGGKYFGGAISGELGNVTLSGGYYKFKDMGKGFVWSADSSDPSVPAGIENGIWFVGAEYKAGDFGLNATYLKGDIKLKGELASSAPPTFDEDKDALLDDDGFVIGLTYKGAEASQPGSWGLFANYYDQGAQTYVAHTTDADTFGMTGFKGFGVGVNYAVAKNAVATLAYYDTKSKLADRSKAFFDGEESKLKSKKLWADLTFTF